jgi:prephenate dehydratase
MVPIENALAGAIDDNFDLLLEFEGLHIVAETQVRIEHNLIGLPGTPLTAIKKVLSHPQGLAQSRKFLESHPEWEAVPFYDTAGSVAHVARTADSSLAAIASAEAARVYGMEILVAGVESNHQNFTRFFQIATKAVSTPSDPNKASIVFATADEPGALSKCLAVFAAHSVNMKKLESRPIQGRPWDYMFYVDVAMPADPARFGAAFAELQTVAKDCRLLGKYRA